MKPVVLTQIFAALTLCIGLWAGEVDQAQIFHERVKPLLESRCFSCHGAEKQKGDLRLDSREAAIKGGETGPSILPGKPDESLLLVAVLHSQPGLEMPPKEKLTKTETDLLERWIKAGAPWPVESSASPASNMKPGETLGNAWTDKRNPIVRIFGGQRLDLWSLKPIIQPSLPEILNKQWPQNSIDHFLAAEWEKENKTPAPEADSRTLARRVFMDVTGAPPTPEQLETFLADKAPQAYERLVDHLLGSPAYGEHRARQWMDVVRYSDSNGFDWDEFRPRAWRFRDYLIRSFNSDKPFNRFITEQLAGDELLEGAPKNQLEQDALIATGFLRMGPQDNSAPLFNEQARARAELMFDLTETTGSAFLGLTMSCCRCHDHKFDPLSQADYFRLRAFFEPVKYADDLPIDLKNEQAKIRTENEQLEKQMSPLRESREALLGSKGDELEWERLAKAAPEERAIYNLPRLNLSDEVKALAEKLNDKIEPKEKEIIAALDDETRKRFDQLGKEIADKQKQKKNLTHALLMTDGKDEQPTRIYFGGDYKQPREETPPGFISALDPNPATIEKPTNPQTTGRRLTLARWISSETNPLTARVFVNRVWQNFFGKGLVETANDFGLAGGRPTHPELLDWLASEFMRQEWSMKKLERMILTSAAYRQSAHPGSSNQATQQRLRRLSAEQLRDAVLQVSGLLTSYPGGPAIWPELPADVLQANPAFLDDNAEKTKGWYPSPEAKRNVRSVYLVQKRTVRIPFMETFDMPENSVSCARRNESIVAPQALSLMNSPLIAQAAEAFAKRVKSEAGDSVEAQIKRSFELAFLRPPDADEMEACHALMKERNLLELCRALLNANEFVYMD
ncbi:MAG: PSD1 and planctomycete cytochrome C domain-containing protein [Verrucomicrobiales bacterium]